MKLYAPNIGFNNVTQFWSLVYEHHSYSIMSYRYLENYDLEHNFLILVDFYEKDLVYYYCTN